MRFLLFLLGCLICYATRAQTLGGEAAYSFLKLSGSPLLQGAGGENVSWQAGDVGVSANNPALLSAQLHGQLNLSFTSFLAGIKAYQLSGGYQHKQSQTVFGSSLFYMDYGSIPQTDAAGNVAGYFRPRDFSFQFSAGRRYMERWQYGLNVKLIHSAYSQYRSAALAVDAGVLYNDTANLLTVSILAKNMGVQLSTYTGEREDLPFDLQAGITRRLSKAPLGFSLTAHHLHRYNLAYHDTTFNRENNLDVSNGWGNRLMGHLVLAAHVYAGPHLEATIGFNYLRWAELSLGSSGNGLTGFSLGARALFRKLQFQYALSHYGRNKLFQQVGLGMNLKELISY